jgi:hypothetical protein
MNHETLQMIQKMADGLGTTATHLWMVLVKQAYIGGVINCILTLIYVLVVAILGICTAITMRGDDEDKKAAMVIACLVFGVVGGIFAIGMLADNLTRLMNPEYWALQQVLETVKGATP